MSNSENSNNEIKKILSDSNYKKEELMTNLDKNNSIESLSELNKDTLDTDMQNIESFRKFYLFQTKKFSNNKTIFGLVHIRLAFFVKEKKRYKKYIETLVRKVEKAIEISDKYNDIKGKFYVYLDLENVNPKNFSRRFLKDVVKIVGTRYVDQLKNYFISGKKMLIKMFWPIISLFLDKIIKKKIICLK